MKRISVVIFYCLLQIGVNAQKLATRNSIEGSVIDSLQKNPLEYATITLFSKGIKKPLNGTVTDKDGHYNLNEIPDGNYELTFEFIGYKPVTIRDILLNKNVAIIKNVSLVPQKGNLQG